MLVDEDPPLIAKVSVDNAGRQIVRVVWKGGKRARTRDDTDFVDLSPAIESGNRYRLLRLRPELFDDIEVVDGGRAIAWFNASITMSAEVVESLCPKRGVRDQALLAAAADSGLAPIINGISPDFAYNGDTVTITGQNFSGITGVFFTASLIPASRFTVIDNNTMTATLPIGAEL